MSSTLTQVLIRQTHLQSALITFMTQQSYFFFFLTPFLLTSALTSLKHLSVGKMKKTKLLISTTLAVMLLASLMAVAAFATTVPAFTLSASSNQLQYTLPQGATFNGTIATTGPLQFWASAPNYTEIVNLGIIDKTTSFSFVATQKGTYSLNFENDLSNSVQVTFSYVTNPVIPGSNPAGVSQTYLIVTVIIAVLGSILIIFIIHRKSKTQASAVQNRTFSQQS